MLVGKDISPFGKLQIVVVLFTLITGSLLNANVFGNIALIILEMKSKASTVEYIIDASNTAMKGIGLGEDLNMRIVSYIRMNLKTLDQQEELAFFSRL